jgi:uncharacterized protein YuzE
MIILLLFLSRFTINERRLLHHVFFQTGLVYIDLAKGKYNKSKKITDDIIVDLTDSGKVLGIEILDTSENIQHFNPSSIKKNPPGIAFSSPA